MLLNNKHMVKKVEAKKEEKKEETKKVGEKKVGEKKVEDKKAEDKKAEEKKEVKKAKKEPKILYDNKAYEGFLKKNPDHCPLPGEHLRMFPL